MFLRSWSPQKYVLCKKDGLCLWSGWASAQWFEQKKNQTPQLRPLERTSPNLSQLKVALLATQGRLGVEGSNGRLLRLVILWTHGTPNDCNSWPDFKQWDGPGGESKYILLLILFLRYACKKFTGYQVGWKWPSQGDEFGRFFCQGVQWFYMVLPCFTTFCRNTQQRVSHGIAPWFIRNKQKQSRCFQPSTSDALFSIAVLWPRKDYFQETCK